MKTARIVTHRRVWAESPHCAFTDLARHRGRWLCAFREADDHAGSPGRIRIISSDDGIRWKTAATFAETGVDLRDPHLSHAPGRRLMLLMGGTEYEAGRFVQRQPRVAFSDDGTAWTEPRRVLDPGDWLWRAAWHGGRAWGVSYRLVSESRWVAELFSSSDGLDFQRVTRFRAGGRPNEAAILFRADASACVLLRREGGDRQAWIGTARPPYRVWSWRACGHRFGGPALVVLPSGEIWAGGRTYRDGVPRVTVGPLGASAYTPALELPSGDDCGYPGMVWHRGLLWMSYYTSHEGSAAIYLARLRVS